MIQIEDACKTLNGKQVFMGINLSVPAGSIFGLIGPNGAGKTTIIKTITGVWKLDQGSIQINGASVFENPVVKEKIGYVPEQCHYYESFRVQEIMEIYKLSYPKFDQKRYDRLNRIFQIEKRKYLRELSKGMKTGLALMLNFCIRPEVLILDEPTSGLDPMIKRKTFQILMDEVAENGTTVFIASHNLGDLERICDHVAIIDKGMLRFQNSIDHLKQNIRKLQVLFNEAEPTDWKNWPEIMRITRQGRVFQVITKQYTEEFGARLLELGAIFVEQIDLDLEEIFIKTFEEGVLDDGPAF